MYACGTISVVIIVYEKSEENGFEINHVVSRVLSQHGLLIALQSKQCTNVRKTLIIETKVSLFPASFRFVASDQCIRDTCNSFGDMLTLNHHHHHHPWLRTQINNCINCVRLIFSLRYAINALGVPVTVVVTTESIRMNECENEWKEAKEKAPAQRDRSHKKR